MHHVPQYFDENFNLPIHGIYEKTLLYRIDDSAFVALKKKSIIATERSVSVHFSDNTQARVTYLSVLLKIANGRARSFQLCKPIMISGLIRLQRALVLFNGAGMPYVLNMNPYDASWKSKGWNSTRANTISVC